MIFSTCGPFFVELAAIEKPEEGETYPSLLLHMANYQQKQYKVALEVAILMKRIYMVILKTI